MHIGWHQLAYERELKQGLSLAWIGAHPLAVVRDGDSIAVFHARCPHRGANLCIGGRLDGDAIICPFHGFRIALGGSGDGLRAHEYRVLSLGGLVFVREPDGYDCGFEASLRALEETHYIVPGFTLDVRTTPEMVIENAFDTKHFQPVHGILNEPEFEPLESGAGAFGVSGAFTIPASPWQKSTAPGNTVSVAFEARAFSPTVLISELGGSHPYCMITTAVPVENGCRVRLSLALKPGPAGRPPDSEGARYLLRQATAGLEKDRVIWENLPPEPWLNAVPSDRWVEEFRAFSARFRRG